MKLSIDGSILGVKPDNLIFVRAPTSAFDDEDEVGYECRKTSSERRFASLLSLGPSPEEKACRVTLF